MPPVNKAVLCYVTDRRSLSPPSRGLENEEALLCAIERAASAGVDWIQIREKDLPAGRLAALVRAAMGRASRSARILVNDRFDVALAVCAGGVHLGEASLPLSAVVGALRARREREGDLRNFLVGASTHSLEDARAAENAGADYIFFGPVFATPSKMLYGPPQGLERLAEVCRFVSIPVLAIGGVAVENAGQCFAAGASGIAAIRLFQEPSDPAQLVKSLRHAAGTGRAPR